jgi:hypothetical protein
MKSILSVIILFSICVSCVYNHTGNTENLGNGYFYLGDGNESQILLGNEKKNSGVTIVPQEVVKYNFDKNFIIAKSSSNVDNKKTELYWIIDKSEKDSIVGLDSLSFVKKLKALNINMILKNRK